MKKIMFAILATTMIGCSGLPSLPTSQKQPSIAEEKIANTVDVTREIYGIGKARISSAGPFVTEERAREQALNDLKSKMNQKIDGYFQQQLALVDTYSKRIYTGSLKELRDYTANIAIGNVTEKASFVNDGMLYIIVTASLEDIFKQSKYTFVEYTSDLLKRLETVKTNVNAMEYIQPIEPMNTAPVAKGEEKLVEDEEELLVK